MPNFREFVGITLGFDGKQALNGLKKTQNAFNDLKRTIVTVVAGKMVRDMANFGKEISMMADRTGMSIEKLSSLRNVFIAAGSGAKGFEATVNKLNQGLLGLNRGEGWLAGALAPLGVSPFGKDVDRLLLEISDAAKRQLDIGRSKAEVLDYLVNRLGIDQYTADKMLGGSQTWLAEKARLQEKVGKQDEQSIENLKEFNSALNELSAAWENFKTNALGKLVVVLQPVIEVVTDILGELTKYPEVGAAVIGTLGAITASLTALAAIRHLGGIFGLGALASAGSAATGGAAATGAAAGSSFAAGAGVAVGAALIAIIVDSITEVIDYFQTGKLEGPIAKFWEWYFDLWTSAWEKYKSILDTGKDWLSEKWGQVKEWAIDTYANARADMGTAYSSSDMVHRINEDIAKGRTKDLFDYKNIVVFTEPVASDFETISTATTSGGMSIVNHFEGSTFGSDLSETEAAINESMTTTLANAVPAL